MGDSQSQFQELLAHLVARTNKMLLAQNEMFPLALLLLADGRIDTSVAAYSSAQQIPALINSMQEASATKVIELGAVASCIAYPDYGLGVVVAFLENQENYCSKIVLPVATEPALHLDTSNITAEDGSVYVFPVVTS